MKMSIWSILALCVLLMEISGLARGDEGLAPKPKESCNYTVTIETTCTRDAGTSNRVNLRFGDVRSNDVLVRHLNSKHARMVDPLEPAGLDDVARKPFQACTVDEFRVTGLCVESPICYLYLKSIGNDGWRPGLAHVRVSGATHLSSEYFYFRRYLPQHVWHGSDTCDTEVTPFGIKHKRKLFRNRQHYSLHHGRTSVQRT